MPSRVADILMQEGANAARAREASGAIWGGAVQNLAQIPQQLQQQAAQRQQQQDLSQERQQRLQIGQANLDELQHNKLGEALTAQLVHQNTSLDDATGHQTTNWDAVTDGLMAKGFVQHAQHARDFGIQDEQRRNEVQNAHLAFLQKQRDYYAGVIGGIASAPKDQQATLYAAARGTLMATAKTDPFVASLPASYPGADQITTLHDSLLSEAERFTRHKDAADEKSKRFKEVPNVGLVDIGAPGEQPKVAVAAAPKEKDEWQTFKESYPKALGVASWDALNPQQQQQAYGKYAASKRDPAMAAIAQQLAETRLAEARQRLAGGTEDQGVSADTRTTATGRSYVDLSKYKGKDYHAAQQQAHAQGVFGASAPEADALANIDTARQNMALIEQHLDKLPSSAATSMLGAGLANRAEAYLQLDPNLAAWGTWRTAAIQAMRALAGSKGLRINRSEIEASTENDIPKITDTQAVAAEKLKRVRAMLESQETGIMGNAGQSAAAGSGDPMGIR